MQRRRASGAAGEAELSSDELAQGLYELGIDLSSDSEFDAMMLAADDDGSGEVALKEFTEWAGSSGDVASKLRAQLAMVQVEDLRGEGGSKGSPKKGRYKERTLREHYPGAPVPTTTAAGPAAHTRGSASEAPPPTAARGAKCSRPSALSCSRSQKSWARSGLRSARSLGKSGSHRLYDTVYSDRSAHPAWHKWSALDTEKKAFICVKPGVPPPPPPPPTGLAICASLEKAASGKCQMKTCA